MKGRGPLFLVDSREKEPWPLRGYRQRRAALKFGDYTIKGLENRVAVERKSAADFAGSLVEGRVALQQNRADLAGVRLVVVVEATPAEVYAAIARVNPARTGPGMIAAAILDAGVVPLFLGDRWTAERFATTLLIRARGWAA